MSKDKLILSERLDSFRIAENSRQKACYLAQAADEARKLEDKIKAQAAEIERLDARLTLAKGVNNND